MLKERLQKVLKLKKDYDIKVHKTGYRIVEITLAFYMHMISKFCEQHPTCDDCCFCQNHWGCYFRNKLPREW